MFDIAVFGAGASGLCAALAAARLGRRVLLVERTSLLGGSNTLSLVGPLMGFTFRGQPIVRGIAQEIVDRLMQRGGSPGHIPDPLGVTDTITPVDAQLLRQVLFDLVRAEPNLTLLLNTWVTKCRMEQGQIRSVHVLGRDGEEDVEAGIYIDATGDGDLALSAGVPFTFGREADHLAQPMTMIFRIRNVDFSAVRRYMQAHPDQFVLSPNALSQPYTAISGYFDLVRQAREDGTLHVDRDRILLFEGVHPGEALVNTSRVLRLNGTSSRDLTLAEMEGRSQVDDLLHFLKTRVDGFAGAELVETGCAIGVRETRHFHCMKTMTAEDIIQKSVFPDSVAVCAFPVDIHDPNGAALTWDHSLPCYDIPFGVMVPEHVQNLLITGRCVSATHEASASLRITPTAMALGQAAGTAAHLALDTQTIPALLDPAGLQRLLLDTGAIPSRKYVTD